MKQLIRKKYRDLGPMSFREFAVLLHFIACVLLWFFRDPQFMKGAHPNDGCSVKYRAIAQRILEIK